MVQLQCLFLPGSTVILGFGFWNRDEVRLWSSSVCLTVELQTQKYGEMSSAIGHQVLVYCVFLFVR
jgi:hypothetical protein